MVGVLKYFDCHPRPGSGIQKITVVDPRVKPEDDNAGFTLLELMIVIAITGILTTVAIVQFNDAKKTAAVRHEAENFAAFVRTTENMSRVGMPLPKNLQVNCNSDPAVEQTPCGGYGVVVWTDRYLRFGDVVNVPQRAANGTDKTVETVTLPNNVRITTTTTPPSFPPSLSHTLIFVPPKDKFCLRNATNPAITPAFTENEICGPVADLTVVFTFRYTGINYTKSVRVNTVSGLVSVE